MSPFLKICPIKKLKTMETQTLNKPQEASISSTHDLIKGTFSPDDALEILQDLFEKKINFNQQKCFKQHLKYGEQDPKVHARIKDLQAALQHVIQRITEAKDAGKSLQINGSLSIELL